MESIIDKKSKAFALRIIKLYKQLREVNKNLFFPSKFSEAVQVQVQMPEKGKTHKAKPISSTSYQLH